MKRVCSCGEEFLTLTEFRLHQRDECPDRDEEIDVQGMDPDEVAERAVSESLVCDVCGEQNHGADGFDTDTTDAGLTITLIFTCDCCGATNTNDAILGGSA